MLENGESKLDLKMKSRWRRDGGGELTFLKEEEGKEIISVLCANLGRK